MACADGKLSRLGVRRAPRTRGSSGRGRRTTRFTPIEAPCASATAAVAVTSPDVSAAVGQRAERAEGQPAAGVLAEQRMAGRPHHGGRAIAPLHVSRARSSGGGGAVV